jgi:hypothetical protein
MTLAAPPEPLSDWGVVRLLARIGLRRWRHRLSGPWSSGFFKKAAPGAEALRRATPRRMPTGPLLAALIGLLFLFGTIANSATFVGSLADQLDSRSLAGPGQVGVLRGTYQTLVAMEQMLRQATDPATRPAGRTEADVRGFVRTQMAMLATHFEGDAALLARTKTQRQELQARFMETFREKGSAGFYAAPHRTAGAWPGRELWPLPPNVPAMTHAAGLVLVWMFVTLVLMSLASQDAGKVGWTLEWLFGLPVSARALMVAQAIQWTILNPVGWILTFGLVLAILGSAGYGVWAVPLAAIVALCMNVMVASVRLIVETWLRQRLAHARLRNLQAVAAILGMLGMMSLFILPHARALPDYILGWLGTLPDGLLLFPPALPGLASRGATYLPAVGGLLVSAVVLLAASVHVAGRLVRGGLLKQSCELQGTRTPAAPGRTWSLFHGIVGKELRMLLRDRAYLAQTLIVPLAMVGFQFLIDPLILEGAAGDGRHAAALAFGVGAYVLAISGIRVLASEGEALWLLYTLPHPIERVMRRKAMLWAVPSAVYAAAILALTTFRRPSADGMALVNAAMALGGVFIYAFFASGIGILAADPLRHGNARKVGAGFVYLYLLLVGLYAYAIYAESVWPKMAQVALCVLVAIAIWRKVRDRMPFLLDPTEGPPPTIGLSDGLIAAFCFFSVQGLLQLALAFSDADTLGPGGRTAVAYTVAGGIVTTLAVLIFAIKKKAHPPPARRATAARALLEGVGWGLGAAAFGLAYLWAARSIAPLRASIEDASRWLSSEGSGEFLLAGLLIVVAPVFEEYLFRGLIFRGMLRSLNPTAAVLASAAIFAMVHPPIWVVPVFVLGVAAALSYRRTGRLGAPILAHMIYSTAVVTSQMIV